jgi:hypothetical protein
MCGRISFGRDMLEDAALANKKSATRLHLGRTVSYSPPSNDPLNRPYRDSFSLCMWLSQFISLLIFIRLQNLSILDDLLPIVPLVTNGLTVEIRPGQAMFTPCSDTDRFVVPNRTVSCRH